MNWKKITAIIRLGMDRTTWPFVLYVLVDSLVSPSKMGVASLVIIAAYLVLNRKKYNTYKKTFAFSFFLIALAMSFFLWDSTGVLDGPIEKFSEWSYMLFLVGCIQLIIFPKRKK